MLRFVRGNKGLFRKLTKVDLFVKGVTVKLKEAVLRKVSIIDVIGNLVIMLNISKRKRVVCVNDVVGIVSGLPLCGARVEKETCFICQGYISVFHLDRISVKEDET